MKQRTAIVVLTLLIATTIVFHLLILVKIIPYDIAWGGRLQNDPSMYLFETVSLFINLFLAWVLLMKGAFVKPVFKEKTLNRILLVFLILFVLNTIGNLFAKTNFEKSMAAVTFVFAVLIWMIIKKKPNIPTHLETVRKTPGRDCV